MKRYDYFIVLERDGRTEIQHSAFRYSFKKATVNKGLNGRIGSAWITTENSMLRETAGFLAELNAAFLEHRIVFTQYGLPERPLFWWRKMTVEEQIENLLEKDA